MLENSLYDCVEFKCRENFSCDISGCYEEGICRCSTIDEVEIVSIDIEKLTNKIFRDIYESNITQERDDKLVDLIWGYNPSQINKWCIDRVLIINRVYDKSNWTYTIQSGYYGEEVEDFYLVEDLFRKVEWQIEEILNIESLKDKVFYLLKLEYGEILEKLKDKEFSVEQVDINKIIFPNSTHLNKVLKNSLSFYTDYSLPKGIVLSRDENYYVIDGYHRLSASKAKKIYLIVAK